jgi:hypothetical protein
VYVWLVVVVAEDRNELIGRANMSNNLILAVLNRSRELCMLQYEKPLWTATSHLTLYNRFNYVFNEQQMRVFAAAYKWRDTVAREEVGQPLASLYPLVPSHSSRVVCVCSCRMSRIAMSCPTTCCSILRR